MRRGKVEIKQEERRRNRYKRNERINGDEMKQGLYQNETFKLNP